MIALIFILLISCPELICCMDGDGIVDFSQYCFVNESTIRIKESEFSVINNTGDWITASNGTNLFVIPANGTNCISLDLSSIT